MCSWHYFTGEAKNIWNWKTFYSILVAKTSDFRAENATQYIVELKVEEGIVPLEFRFDNWFSGKSDIDFVALKLMTSF